MKYTFSKRSLALALILPILFISDIFYGLLDYLGISLSVTPGIVLRGGVLAVAAYYAITRRRWADPLLRNFTLVLVVLAQPSTIISLLAGPQPLADLVALAKALYFPFVTLLLAIWIHQWRLPADLLLRYVEYSAYFLGMALFVSQVLGINRQTYGDYAYGNLGVFYAQNDMTLAFGLALLAASYRLVFARFSWFRLLLLVLSGYACMQIGTRAALLAVMAAALAPIVCLLRAPVKNKSSKRLMINFLVGALLLTSLGFLLVEALHKQQEHRFQQQKLESLVQGEHPRSSLIKAGADQLAAHDPIYDLTGEGMSRFQTEVANRFDPNRTTRFVEVDWMDLLGAFGWPFTILLHLLLLWALIGSGWQFWKIGIPTQGLAAAGMLLYLGQSALAGHALTSPIPSTLASAYAALYWAARYQNRICRLATDLLEITHSSKKRIWQPGGSPFVY